MLFALFCVLLIGHHVQAVVNKATSQVPLTKEEEKTTKVKADDRISNTFGSPSDEYGPPLGSGFKGPAPVYGPPELVGNLGPTPIYPPPPPELPPPAFGPLAISYGPPLSVKPQYGPPKPNFGLATSSLFSKPIYGPPKLHYGLPKQHFTPPLVPFPSFRSPKPQYGPPLKLVATSSQQYIPPKPGHGPPIPISLQTYGPPPPKLAIQFNPLPNDEYGPPPPPVSAPQPQYGPPAGDLYGPPPPAPPPGVPAPPTPPDIKYDGWQPIAAWATAPNQSPPTDTYGPPLVDAKHNYVESSSQLSHAQLSADSNVPSDSYGVPLQNPDDQDLKTSVHESSASSENNGLPPPPLPQNEPLHNNQGPGAVTTTSQSDHQFGRQQLNLQYGAPNIEPLSIVKTVGFELLPTTGALNADISGLPLSGGATDVSSLNHISNSVNANSAPHHSGLELTSDNGGFHADALSNGGDSHGFQNVENDLSLELPKLTPASDYGPPLATATFGNPADHLSGVPLLSPPPFNSYGAPPLSSYSPNGPYPAAHGGRGPLFSSFGIFGGSFHRQNLHSHRLHGPFRPPPFPIGSLIPPRNREPIKFREPIPTGLLSNINRYLPPPAKQQLPNLHVPVSFRHTSGSNNLFSGPAGSFNVHNSPIAAPHVQYGIPLSFNDFNTPTPHLTYGAPNFGPPTSFTLTPGYNNNLYSGIGNTLTTTYGTPVVNAPLSIGGGYDCNSLQPLLPVNGALHSSTGLSATGELPLSGSLPSGGELHSSGEQHLSGGLSSGGEVPSSEGLSLGGGLPAHSSGKLQLGFGNAATSAGNADIHNPVFTGTDLSDTNNQNSIFADNALPLTKPLGDFLGGPSLNTLDLQHNEQQKINLKDSYGNPVGLTYDSSNEASDTRAVHTSVADVSNELSGRLPSQSNSVYPAAALFEQGSEISAEALTASLTAQSFGQQKSIGSSEVDASQFLKSSEGSEALALAQRLTADNADGFEIQGSKGTYRLQIQPADGGLGTENSDGSIRHDQVLSNGLLQDILAAIEQPESGPIQLQGLPQAQQLDKVFGPDVPQSTNGHFITVDSQAQDNGLQDRVEKISDSNEDKDYSKNQSVALFFNTKFGESRKEIRSVSKNETLATTGNEHNSNKTISS
ncbi:PREDICTED: uncharacterized protein LOC105567995 [Vollenhovia emeryi]|uniref:uncharacterized protein LOC105567995 n=1 Tax=Vollenhovia emeryi TaxID=411798 RepID=UPI0005F4CE63|nr:PREDICTED: uncharacterized protein LOC105567995 [Vollenhovia emeryi]